MASWPRLEDSVWRDAGRRQRHSIAGQMSYLKMLGLARGNKPGGSGLFSTAVISGSSSAPNLRVMIPAAAATNSEYLHTTHTHTYTQAIGLCLNLLHET